MITQQELACDWACLLFAVMLAVYCGLFSGCSKPSDLKPRTGLLAWKQLAEGANYVAVGNFDQCEPKSGVHIVQILSEPGHVRTDAPYRAYVCTINVAQWVRAPAQERVHGGTVYTFRIEHSAFTSQYRELMHKRLWFLRKEAGVLRPLTDRGTSSIDLGDLPNGVTLRTGDGTARAIAAALLDEELALKWPSYSVRLPVLVGMAGEFLSNEDVAAHLEKLHAAPAKREVQDAVCVELYVNYDKCVDGARDFPYFKDLEPRRRPRPYKMPH